MTLLRDDEREPRRCRVDVQRYQPWMKYR